MAADVFGVVTPHPPIFVQAVGGARARTTQDSLDALALARDAIAAYRPDVIVLMSPHAPAAYDTFLVDTSEKLAGALSDFGDRTVYEWPGDPEFATALVDRLDASDISTAPRDADPRLRAGWLDHATIVPLSFLEPSGSVPLVVLSLSYLAYDTHRRLGEIVRELAEELGRRVVFVASGDLSHRLTPDAPAGYSPRGAELDEAIVEHVRTGRLGELVMLSPDLIESGGECGLRSIITLGGFAGGDPVPTRILAYEGPWGVGYLTALVGEDALDAAARVTAATAAADRPSGTTPESGQKGGMPGSDASEIVRLARATIERYVRSEETPPAPAPLEGPEYPATAGAFVSLHRGGELRGCIGTIAPTQGSLAAEVVHNAVEAAVHDPRFPPVGPDELDDLDVKVDVLHAPESCELGDLDPSRYGVIVTQGWRRGLLLPDLEGVDDVATQVSIAMRKAGISEPAGCELQRFRVDRYT